MAGFTGQVDTTGLLEFAARTYDPASSTWLQDDPYRGTTARSASLNRYAYVEGAPETFVDAYGFHRAAAILQAQRLAAAQAAKAAAQRAVLAASPRCTGYFGCYPTGLFRQTLAGHAADYAVLSAPSSEARRRQLAALQVRYANEQAQIWREAAQSGDWTDVNGESVLWNSLQSWGVGALNDTVTFVPNILAWSWNAGPGSLVTLLGGSGIPYWTAFSNPNSDSIYGASYLSGEILGPQILIGGPLGKAGKAAETATVGERAVVIGEDMTNRVEPFAQKIGARTYKADPTAPREMWMENNRLWIRKQVEDGCTVYDCGPAPGRSNFPEPTSPYYKMELGELTGYPNYVRVWLGD